MQLAAIQIWRFGQATSGRKERGCSRKRLHFGQALADILQRLQHVVESSRASKDEVQGLSAEAMIDYGVIIFGLWELMSRTGIENFIAPSHASVPELQKKTLEGKARSRRRWASSLPGPVW